MAMYNGARAMGALVTLGPVVIMQGAGESVTAVMSQHAVTAALNALNNGISPRLDRVEKQIANFIEGGALPFEVDASVAYRKTVPEGALPYAMVSKVGGMSHVVNGTLVHAKPTAVRSTGANKLKLQFTDQTVNGIAIKANADGGVTMRGTATAHVNFTIAQTPLRPGSYTLSGMTSPRGSLISSDFSLVHNGGAASTFEVSESKTYTWNVYFDAGDSIDVTVYPMLNEGPTARPFSCYTEALLQIPEAVQALRDYGLGIDETLYNYVDWFERVYHRQAGAVDLSALGWEASGGLWLSYSLVGTAAPNTGVCGAYTVIPTTATEDAADKTIQIRENIIYLKDSSITDASQIAGLLVYGLAEPETVDISGILPADNVVPVEAGGESIAENANGLAAPTEIIYQFKEDAA